MLGMATLPAAAQTDGKANQASSEIKAVLELFTSQGCSSCPPADALMEGFSKRNDVLALSYPVDYWDYLGWKDTLANPKFSARQRSYAKHRGDGRVYTPQMVISGGPHVVGSSSHAIDKAITSSLPKFAKMRVPVRVTLDKRHINIETGEAPQGVSLPEATIWLAMVRREVEVEIKRGENRGKKIKYFNVVKELNPIGMWTGKRATLQLPRDAMAGSGNEMCAVLVQVGNGGPIIGAAAIQGL